MSVAEGGTRSSSRCRGSRAPPPHRHSRLDRRNRRRRIRRRRPPRPRRARLLFQADRSVHLTRCLRRRIHPPVRVILNSYKCEDIVLEVFINLPVGNTAAVFEDLTPRRLPPKRAAWLSESDAGGDSQQRCEYQQGTDVFVSLLRSPRRQGTAGRFGELSVRPSCSINSSRSWWASRKRGACSSDLSTSRRASCGLPDWRSKLARW